jgi:predicted nucleotidyltransferase
MGAREEILNISRGLKPELAIRYKVKEVGLFGSFVREGRAEASDIDILVEFDSPIGFFKFLELEEFLGERLGRRVDLVSKKALKPRIGRRILQEVVTV